MIGNSDIDKVFEVSKKNNQVIQILCKDSDFPNKGIVLDYDKISLSMFLIHYEEYKVIFKKDIIEVKNE